MIITKMHNKSNKKRETVLFALIDVHNY